MFVNKHKIIITLLQRELPKLYLKWEREANVDNGGCGFMAKFLYQGFESLGYKPQIRILMSPYDLMGTDMHRLKAAQDLIISKDNSQIKTNADLCEMGVIGNHYMLKWNGYYIDLSGCYTSIKETKDWSFLDDAAFITPGILKRIASSYEGWNTRFQSQYIDEIAEDIEKVFKKIKAIIARQEAFNGRFIPNNVGFNLLSA